MKMRLLSKNSTKKPVMKGCVAEPTKGASQTVRPIVCFVVRYTFRRINMSEKAKGRKGRLGKNKHRITSYYSNNRYEWNKARKIVHHLRRYGEDAKALLSLKTLLAAMSLALGRKFKAAYRVDL